MRRVRSVILCVMCIIGVTAGCSQERKPIQANTGNIPLKVWVVLGPGESIGNTSNKGCRLSSAQIGQYIEQLQKHSGIYGQNVVFQWQPSTPAQAQDSALLPFQSRTRDLQAWHPNVVQNYWQSGHLNIYFVGIVQSVPSAPRAQYAMTLDPANAQSTTPNQPWVLINDGGYETPGGFVHTPDFMRSLNLLEHEVTHYLARFAGDTFGQPPNQRVYDSTEHLVSGSTNNILLPTAQTALPLVIPGRWNQTGTEEKEIWDRVWAGNWNNP